MKTHAMTMTDRSKTGIETWRCQTCARSVFVTRNPLYRKTVFEVGDKTARHTDGEHAEEVTEGTIIEELRIKVAERDAWLSAACDTIERYAAKYGPLSTLDTKER